LICVTMAMESRFYRVCGQPFRPVRFDALTLAPQDAQEPQGRSRLPDDLAAGSSASPAHDPGTAGKAVARPRGWRACPGPSVRRAKLQETKAELRQRMHQTIPDQGHCLRQVVTRLRSQSVAGATAARRAVVELSRGKRVDGGRIFLRIFEPAIL
jgi:hypothetical protein